MLVPVRVNEFNFTVSLIVAFKKFLSRRVVKLPSTMTTQSLVSDPREFVAIHLYLPESLGWAFITSMVMTPSVWVMGYLAGSRSLPPFCHLIWKNQNSSSNIDK